MLTENIKYTTIVKVIHSLLHSEFKNTFYNKNYLQECKKRKLCYNKYLLIGDNFVIKNMQD